MMSASTFKALLVAFVLLALMTVVAFMARPMMAIDETRYVSVAWEMWLRGDWLVPIKNGVPYSHKPPMLMWVYHLGWLVFGVSEWWVRLVSPLFAAASFVLTLSVAARLWPAQREIPARAVLVLSSSLLWIFFATSAMFDVMLAFYTLLAMYGLLLAAKENRRRGFLIFGLALGLGVLTKGPVIILHTMPVALLAPWWRPGLARKQWYGRLTCAVFVGVAIALAWAIPAGVAGGAAYRDEIFWGQTADRMVRSFAHQRPYWWYLPLLPVMFFPWLLWLPVWRGLGQIFRREPDTGERFCIAWFVPVLICFSLISGKQMHYLIPIFPAFALLVARLMGDSMRTGTWLPPLATTALGVFFALLASGHVNLANKASTELPVLWPALVLTVVGIVLCIYGWHRGNPLLVLVLCGGLTVGLIQVSLSRAFFNDYDTQPLAKEIAALQADGHMVANAKFYHDEYHFAGRLRKPLVTFTHSKDLHIWLSNNPQAYVVLYLKNNSHLQGRKVIISHGYSGGVAALMDAGEAIRVLDGEL